MERKKENDLDSSSRETLYDLETLKKLTSGIEDFMQEMIAIFLESFGKDMNELKLAVETQNNTMVKSQAHKMKTSVLIFGLRPLNAKLLEIEALAKKNGNFKDIGELMAELSDISDRATRELEELLKELEAEQNKTG